MFTSEFSNTLDKLIERAPATWLTALCENLRAAPASPDPIPHTINPDLRHLAASIIHHASGRVTLETLSYIIAATAVATHRWRQANKAELLWTIPSSASQSAAKRIDQAFYDKINAARHEILLVTFAAYRMSRLTKALVSAVRRGVRLRMVLEFKKESSGQLTFDAVNAFPGYLKRNAEIYYWPLESRERSKKGRPGKLHAKIAVIDDEAIISSANLTDDAFTRNMELGAMITGHNIPERLKEYCSNLIVGNKLRRWEPPAEKTREATVA
jgi:cardiolipin synthase